MIDIKILTKPKKAATAATTAGTRTTYIRGTTAEADHAARADKAKKAEQADQADYAAKAGTARMADYASKAGELDADAQALQGLAHKDRAESFEKEVSFQDVVSFQAQTTFQSLATFLGEALLKGKATFGGESTFGAKALFEKLAEFADITAKGTCSLQDLTVWGKAVFHELEIRRLSYAGGNVYLSGAGSKIAHVEEMDDGWRCYLLADDGTTATQNLWQPRDQVRCQTFNISPGAHQGTANRQYWRVVTQVGADTVELHEGKRYAYIDIAKDNCLEGSDAPQEGDTIVLDGCQDPDKADRQGVLMLESTGTGAPRIVAYKGVCSYTHEGREVFCLSPMGTRIVSTSIEWVSGTGETMHIVNYRGAWQEGTQYAYYDQVNHQNAIYTCTNAEGTTQEPSPTSADWTLVLSGEKGEKGEDAPSVQIVSDRGNVILNGEGSRTLTAHVFLGSEDITSQLPPTAFTWRRTSQDSTDDQVWNKRHEGVGNQITVSKEDIFRSAMFTCEATIE